MNTSVINKLPLQTERKFRVLLCPMEVPSSLASADHRDGRASPGDEEQMHVLAHNLPLLMHTAYLESLNLSQLTSILIHLFYSQWMNVFVQKNNIIFSFNW
jgi:hypothetical protein